MARERGLRLHVEGGEAWTLNGEFIRDTSGNSSGSTASVPVGAQGALASDASSDQPGNAPVVLSVTDAEAAAADSMRVRDTEVERESRRHAWIGEVFRVLDAGDDVVALAAAVGSHGRAGGRHQSTWAPSEARTDAEREGEVWIDTGADDKRKLNALHKAAKLGRVACVRALLDVHGARVNAQADRSLFTALTVAAHEGHVEVVRALLDTGADATLTNKWGETPFSVASKAGYRGRGVVELLQQRGITT